MEESVIRELPNHASIPLENVFSGQDGFCKSADRAVALVENFLFTNVLTNALHFHPLPSDVVLISGPSSQQEMLGRIIACLVSDFSDSLAEDYATTPWTVPWIESRYCNLSLDAHFFSPKVRVFRTQMGLSLMNPRRHREGTKCVVLIRNPVDLRASFFKYLRECYLVQSEEEPDFDFDEFFPMADAFLHVPVSLCEMGNPKASSYEQFILNWYGERDKFHLVFYEALISSPEREVKKLAEFLQVKFNPKAMKLLESDKVEGMGASLFASASSIRSVNTFWEENFAQTNKKHLRSYESLYEYELKEVYPFPQRCLPKELPASPSGNAADPNLASLKHLFVSKVRSSAKLSADVLKQAQRQLLALKSSPLTSSNYSDEEWAKLAKESMTKRSTTREAESDVTVQMVVDEMDDEEEELEADAQQMRATLLQRGLTKEVVSCVERKDSLSEML